MAKANAKKQEAPNIAKIGGNITGLLKEIAAGRDKIIELKGKRDDINAKIGEVRASMKAKGIPKKAFDDALKYFEEDPDKRDGYDNGYILAREAMGLPIKGAQLSLLDDETNGAQAEGDADAN